MYIVELQAFKFTQNEGQLKKRELSLVDTSGYQVRLTLWGKNAETFEHFDAPVVAIKGVKVGDYGGTYIG